MPETKKTRHEPAKAKDGIQSFYIDCHEWNWLSRRDVEKAGYTLIGFGWEKRDSLTFKPL
jgi:hypothetical protein